MEASGATNGSLVGAMEDPSLTTTSALVAYLRMEADLADEKAKRLRAQASALCERFGVTDEMQSHYELDPHQLPPMDENGVPKYRGKKRGRKPKPRKRKLDPNRRKRQHTAYTLFVQEIYPGVKAQNPHLQSKDVISIVAKQWKEQLTSEEKQDWKERAKATHLDDDEDEDDDETEVGEAADENGHHHLEVVADVGGEAEATAAADAVYQQAVAEMEEEEDDEDDDDEDEIDEEAEAEEQDEEEEEPEEPPPPVRRRRGRPKKS